MADNPHHYTLRKEWVDDDFVWAVKFLRANGYESLWQGVCYTQIDVNEAFYWTMGDTIPGTILINRKKSTYDETTALGFVVNAVCYDAMADKYDGLRQTPEAGAENREVFDIIGSLVGKDVLDVGCGTGRTLDEADVSLGRYIGIDPSFRMLYHLQRGYPAATVLKTSLYDFVSPVEQQKAEMPLFPLIDVPADDARGEDGKFDVVLALFGVGSYLTQEELRRIPLLLRPGGRAAVMFYRERPRLYDATGVECVYATWREQFPDAIARAHGEYREIEVGGHVLVVYDRAL